MYEVNCVFSLGFFRYVVGNWSIVAYIWYYIDEIIEMFDSESSKAATTLVSNTPEQSSSILVLIAQYSPGT